MRRKIELVHHRIAAKNIAEACVAQLASQTLTVGTSGLVALAEPSAIYRACSPLRGYKILELNFQPRQNLMMMKILPCSLIGVVSFAFASAQPDRSAEIKISLSDNSIKVGDTELRTGPSVGKARYISKKAAEKVFGSVADEYSPGRVIVYAWPNLGVQIQEGLRGSSEGKIFKFIAFFENNRRDDKDSGEFKGHVVVSGIDIDPSTSFESNRPKLTEKGFQITTSGNTTYARKDSSPGQIQIYKSEVGGSDKIEWIEA